MPLRFRGRLTWRTTRISSGRTLPDVETRGKTNDQIFGLGNEAYESDELETACAYYLTLVERGRANGALYFNLANAYFRTGDFGRAVLYYNKAETLRPRDANLAHNLDYARTFLIDEPVRSPG